MDSSDYERRIEFLEGEVRELKTRNLEYVQFFDRFGHILFAMDKLLSERASVIYSLESKLEERSNQSYEESVNDVAVPVGQVSLWEQKYLDPDLAEKGYDPNSYIIELELSKIDYERDSDKNFLCPSRPVCNYKSTHRQHMDEHK